MLTIEEISNLCTGAIIKTESGKANLYIIPYELYPDLLYHVIFHKNIAKKDKITFLGKQSEPHQVQVVTALPDKLDASEKHAHIRDICHFFKKQLEKLPEEKHTFWNTHKVNTSLSSFSALLPPNTLLYKATQKANVHALNFLLAHKADPNKQCPLALACKLGRPDITHSLLQAGANANDRMYKPLYTAICHSHTHLIPLLLKHGAHAKEKIPFNEYEKQMLTTIEATQQKLLESPEQKDTLTTALSLLQQASL